MKICKTCGNSFSTSIVINGIMKNCNLRTNCWNCNPFGNRKKLYSSSNILRTEKVCACCKILKDKSNFQIVLKRNKQVLCSYCKSCTAEKTKNRFRLFKQKCLEYKGNKCKICGYNKCPAALDFHHRNPKEKKFGICQSKNRSFNDNIKRELDKCDILCANCHRELEYL
jgi:hypothetical protein